MGDQPETLSMPNWTCELLSLVMGWLSATHPRNCSIKSAKGFALRIPTTCPFARSGVGPHLGCLLFFPNYHGD
ncbi:hypothetical protein V2G26_016152 [Clonostachys chloroleuca]